MQQEQVRVLHTSDWSQCRMLWETFSPHRVIDDMWEFREAYAKGEQATPYFLYIEYDGAPCSLLPLQHAQNGSYEVFGGFATDNTVVWGDTEEATVQALFTAVPTPANVWPLAKPYTDGETIAREEDAVYALPLSDYASLEDYLQKKWSPDSRKTLKKRFKKLEEQGITIVKNRYTDLPRLFELNAGTYGERSTFIRLAYRKQILSHFLSLFTIDMVSIEVGGTVQAVGYAIVCNKTYVGLYTGVSREVNNLGKYLHCVQISRAIELGCEVYDVGKSNTGGWKTDFKLTPHPQYNFWKP